MKTFPLSILRSVCSLVLGGLLVAWPDAAVIYLVISIGVLFLVSGLTVCIHYFAHRNAPEGRSFPLTALGSCLLGFWLMVMPAFFVSILMYLMGGILVLAGVHMLSCLLSQRRKAPLSAAFFVVPALVTLAGILVLANPFATASIPFVLLGISCLCYGISELVNYFKFYRHATPTPEAIVVEEVPAAEETNSTPQVQP